MTLVPQNHIVFCRRERFHSKNRADAVFAEGGFRYGLSIEFLFDEESGFDPTTWWPALPDSTRESGSKTRCRVTDRDSRSSFAEYIKTSDLTNPAYDVNGKAIEVEPTAPRHVTWPGIETIVVPPPKTDMPAPLVPQSSFYQVDEIQ